MGLIDIYRTFCPKAAEYTFFPSAHSAFSRTDHMLGIKQASVNLRKIEFMSSVFSDLNVMRLEINYKKKNAKNTNT